LIEQGGDLKANKDGKPAIAYVNYDAQQATSYIYRCNKRIWTTTKVAQSRNVYHPSGLALAEKDPSSVYSAEN